MHRYQLIETNLTRDTNLTLNFSMSRTPPYIDSSTIVLTDMQGQHSNMANRRGGFAKLNRTFPDHKYADSQNDPKLGQRAYAAAWLQNGVRFPLTWCLTMYVQFLLLYLHAGNSTVGTSYPLNITNVAFTLNPSPNRVGGYLQETYGLLRKLTHGLNMTFNGVNYPFYLINYVCQGAGGGDPLNISTIGVSCGMVL